MTIDSTPMNATTIDVTEMKYDEVSVVMSNVDDSENVVRSCVIIYLLYIRTCVPEISIVHLRFILREEKYFIECYSYCLM